MRRQPSGHALFVALIVMVLVAAAASLLASHYGFRTRLASQQARRVQLVALADAAVAESLANLADDRDFGGVPRKELGGGTFASKVEPLPQGRFLIVATADYRGWSRQLRVRVRWRLGAAEIESWTALPRY